MFPASYFPTGYFAERYFPPGLIAEQVLDRPLGKPARRMRRERERREREAFLRALALARREQERKVAQEVLLEAGQDPEKIHPDDAQIADDVLQLMQLDEAGIDEILGQLFPTQRAEILELKPLDMVAPLEQIDKRGIVDDDEALLLILLGANI